MFSPALGAERYVVIKSAFFSGCLWGCPYIEVGLVRETVFLTCAGVLTWLGEALCFEDSVSRRLIPGDEPGEILIYGEVSFDKTLLDFCTEKRIILHFFDYYGYYSGSYYPRLHQNSAHLLLKQAEYHTDGGKRLDVARRLTRGAVGNILHVLQYHTELGDAVEAQMLEVEKLNALIGSAGTLEQLREHLEKAREAYYSGLDVMLGLPDFRFLRRSRQPPDDPLNALISFGNSLLYAQLLSAIFQTRLDPRIAFLHGMENERFNLHLDLAEVFKPILVGRTIFILLKEGKQLTKADFHKANAGITLTERGKQAFIAEWETRLTKTVRHKVAGKEVTYRQLLEMELAKLAEHLTGTTEYVAYKHK